MFSFASPHRGDSKGYTQYSIFNIKMKITLNYPKYAAMGFFQGSQERVRTSRGKRAISVDPLKFHCILFISYLIINVFRSVVESDCLPIPENRRRKV